MTSDTRSRPSINPAERMSRLLDHAATARIGRGREDCPENESRVLLLSVRDIGKAGFPATPLLRQLRLRGISCDFAVQTPTPTAQVLDMKAADVRVALSWPLLDNIPNPPEAAVRDRLRAIGAAAADAEALPASRHPFAACAPSFGRMVASMVARRHYGAILVTEVAALWALAELGEFHPPVIFLVQDVGRIRPIDEPCLELAEVVVANSRSAARTLIDREVPSRIIVSADDEDGFRALIEELDFTSRQPRSLGRELKRTLDGVDISIEAVLMLAGELVKRRQLKKAVELLNDAATLYRESVEIWRKLAEVALKSKGYGLAQASAFKALALDPLDGASWRTLEAALREDRKTPLAREAAERARLAGDAQAVDAEPAPPPKKKRSARRTKA